MYNMVQLIIFCVGVCLFFFFLDPEWPSLVPESSFAFIRKSPRRRQMRKRLGGQTTCAPHTALSKRILLLIFVCDFRFTSAVPRFTAVLVSTIQILTVSTQCSLCFFKQFLLLVPTPSQVLYLSRKTYHMVGKFGEH